MKNNRFFTYNGRKFQICDVPSMGKKDSNDKYYLAELDHRTGFYKSCHDPLGDSIKHFSRIDDCKKYVRDNDYWIVSEV